MIGRYTSKMARDAGIAVTMAGLAFTGAIEQVWIKAAAIVAAAGAAICAFSRVPLAINEVSGFKTGVGKLRAVMA